jgi:AraC family transcriptional regulator, transcriptional activator of pobA
MDTIRTSSKLKHYEGLYGDISHKPDAEYMFLEAIETRSKGFDWVIDPHVHSHLYQLFFIESGSVKFIGISQETLLKAPCILFVPPSTLHGLHYSTDVNGQILTLSDYVVEMLFPQSSAVMMILEKLQWILFPEENPMNFAEVMNLIKTASHELFSDHTEKKLMLDAILKQLLLIIYRIGKNNDANFSKQNKSLDYYARFLKMLKNDNQTGSIPSLAKEIGITPAHLNRICRKVSGKSTLAIVHEVLIQKAQNYLAHTSYSVSEIAYLLHFEYQNHFARVFKKITGVSPLVYRRSKR